MLSHRTILKAVWEIHGEDIQYLRVLLGRSEKIEEPLSRYYN